MFPVAIQVYSVRDDAAADMMGTLKKIADMGYDGVEFAGFYGYGAEEIRAELDKLGLKAVSSHVPFATLRSDLEATAEYHKILGCKYIAVPYLEEKDRPGTENWQKTIDDILAIGKYLHSQGIQLLYHNHDFEFVKIDGKYALDMLYDAVPAEYLKTELDTCWVKFAGEDPAAYLHKYAGRSPIVHLKDFYVEGSVKDAATPYALINADGTDQEVLDSENVGECGALICLTDRDEENIIAGMYGARRGAKKVIVKVNRLNTLEVMEELGIESVVSPKVTTANAILRSVRALNNSQNSVVEKVYGMLNGKVEAYEFTALEGARYLNIPLSRLNIRPGVLVSVLVRSHHNIIPFGGDHIEAGDTVILTAKAGTVVNLEDAFDLTQMKK